MRGALVSVLFALVACGSEPPPAPTLPADALPGMSSETTDLSAASLSRDAVDRSALATLLDDAGYVSGRQRTFAGPGKRFSLAVTRVLVFEGTDGADAYLGWLRTHPEELLGATETLEPLDLPGSPFLIVHLPGGCCPKAVPIYLSAWRRGSRVLFIQASGREADPAAVKDLATAFDQVVRGADA